MPRKTKTAAGENPPPIGEPAIVPEVTPLEHEVLTWPELPPGAPPPANPDGNAPPDAIDPRKAKPQPRKRWFKKG